MKTNKSLLDYKKEHPYPENFLKLVYGENTEITKKHMNQFNNHLVKLLPHGTVIVNYFGTNMSLLDIAKITGINKKNIKERIMADVDLIREYMSLESLETLKTRFEVGNIYMKLKPYTRHILFKHYIFSITVLRKPDDLIKYDMIGPKIIEELKNI